MTKPRKAGKTDVQKAAKRITREHRALIEDLANTQCTTCKPHLRGVILVMVECEGSFYSTFKDCPECKPCHLTLKS